MRSAADSDRAGESGAALASSLVGFTVFIAFLLFAVQLLVGLYGTSVVTAAAYDGARLASGAAGGPTPAARRAAEDHVTRLLGTVGHSATFEWSSDGSSLSLRVRTRNPRFVLPVLGGALGVETVDRTATVRIEQLR